VKGVAVVEPVVLETAGWIRRAAEAEAVEVRLEYDPADPLAVRIRIGTGPAATTWVLARDLLADGLRSMVPVGEGCVQVQATSVLTEVSRRSRDGSAVVLRLPWWNTREFVRLTQSRVPRGQEVCDVDAWVAALTEPREP